MNQNVIKLMFALIRSVICGKKLTNEERELYSADMLTELISLSNKHDIAHLVVHGLTENGLLSAEEQQKYNKIFMMAIYRVTKIDYELNRLCDTLENAQIPFIPLKGSILRKYYPEEWMRTSCDIDVLIQKNDLDRAISCLTECLNCKKEEVGSHDITFFTQSNVNIELHHRLVEEGRANKASEILEKVWDYAIKTDEKEYQYELTDDMFYFYHIAHMAKHFESGGCGVRPFIDLWMLNRLDGTDKNARKKLLEKGGLLRFAECSEKLSRVWLEDATTDELIEQFSKFIFQGGMYGSIDNRVILQQQKKGGKFKYILSRLFLPYNTIKFQYPILQKHKWLTPFMEIRRWFKLFNRESANRAKFEYNQNKQVSKSDVDTAQKFLNDIGL